MLKWIFEIINSFFPRFDGLMELGYKAKTFNNDFILFKHFDHFEINIHQSVEPFNYRFEHLIDFEIDDGCIILYFKKKSSKHQKQVNQLRELFDYTFEREDFIFCMFKKMDLEDPRLPSVVSKIETIFS